MNVPTFVKSHSRLRKKHYIAPSKLKIDDEIIPFYSRLGLRNHKIVRTDNYKFKKLAFILLIENI